MQGSEQKPLVEVSKLGKRFGDFWAVKDLSLQVHPGEVYGLLGPNGAGKTTTLRILAGLLKPTQGKLQVMGESPSKAPLSVRKKLGFLTGSTGLYQRLTPIETLDFFGKIYGIDRKTRKIKIEKLVEDLDLQSFAKQACGTLSTGQKQRVNIARALIHEPTFLILDEPTSGLDIISANFILETIQLCRKQGKAVLFSTHILAETELICDRIGILHKGKMIEEGTVEALKSLHQSPSLADAFLKIIQSANQEKAFEKVDQKAEQTPISSAS